MAGPESISPRVHIRIHFPLCMFERLHYEFLWRRPCSRTCQETDSYFSFAAWNSESELYWGAAMRAKIPAPTLGYLIARALNHWIWNYILGFSLTKFPRGQCLWQNLAITEQLFSISLPTPEWNDFQHLTFLLSEAYCPGRWILILSRGEHLDLC